MRKSRLLHKEQFLQLVTYLDLALVQIKDDNILLESTLNILEY